MTGTQNCREAKKERRHKEKAGGNVEGWEKGAKGSIGRDKGACEEGSGHGEAAARDVRAVETWAKAAWERERERYEFA